ncbi:carbamoyl-phosphate synthase large subunit [Kallotenue papyrolyticum]|uniref:carbamoyl-phosphate synthase large subunit n=1 Tax=Kallotenue papyrolyticum TaxID=1325125 RepID=UPI0004927A6B|nr:carbamoyl-phosphate synthase large subunit [Kallotenue papyrolyticum]
MPKRTDIHSILILGAGPIVIGQACEFDYSGVQACKALREEGYRVILVNSNPATIMTDPEFADATYIEPLTVESVRRIIAKERPDAVLPTVGGQTALNLAVALHKAGVLQEFGCELIGASVRAVEIAEDRQLFKEAMQQVGLPVARSGIAHSLDEALQVVRETGFPAIIRPSFTLGGTGGGIAYNMEEFRQIVETGLDLSPIHQVLVEESVLGWKEFELEVMRDRNDNVVIICSIENLDPMGVHTGDSITVAPAQTLTDREYQRLRDMATKVMNAVGVETGGSNVQFAVNPRDGRALVIEMNPRVSRSSALASKATGFPIAKIAAKLAVGYTLDELPNDITRETPASFEPTLDYVVVKIPRFAFEKFPGASPNLGTQMKSVGEVMAIGRTFAEAWQKAWSGLEIGRDGWGADGKEAIDPERVREFLITPRPERPFYVRYALQSGMDEDQVARLTGYDPWFVAQFAALLNLEGRLRAFRLETVPPRLLREAKRMGFSDRQLAHILGSTAAAVRARRTQLGILPTFQRVDTCAAEFPAYTPYLYSSYETESEAEPTGRCKVIILGSGPNRIGQGLEFDYCCVHAVFALRQLGYETVMVNCNPETVSTDYDTADRLYFEPLTLEHVLNVVAEEARGLGLDPRDPQWREKIAAMRDQIAVIVQFGGQTPLKLARDLEAAGVPILGTTPNAIDLAEDRERFGALLRELGIPQPANGTATSIDEALAVARQIGYPVVVRPSYVLGGRGMAIVYNDESLTRYMREAAEISPDHPVLIDQFLEDAYEFDVDAVADGHDVVIAGIMHQIELAGVHSGDSAAVLPAALAPEEALEPMRRYTVALAKALGVVGLMNVQFAWKDGVVYVLEVNPRASRTVPFVSKATGIPWAKVAAQLMAGRTLRELGINAEPTIRGFHVKEVVLPWQKFAGVDTNLGPEMRSTGEGMGSGETFGEAYAKAQLGCFHWLPLSGSVFLSVNDRDKEKLVPIAREFANLGFKLVATSGTAAHLARHGIHAETVFKVNEGRPNVVDLIKNEQIDLIINTPLGRASFYDELAMRRAGVQYGVTSITTLAGAAAAVEAIKALRSGAWTVRSLQEWHRQA